MKKRIIVISTVIALAALAIGTAVHAGPGRHRGGHMGDHGFGLGMFRHLERIQSELQLSDQQVDQIKAIFAEVHQQNKQHREQMHGGLKGAAELLLENPNDISGAQALLDQQIDAERAMKSNVLQATSKALNVLNAEQRSKLSAKLADHAERWKQRKR